MTRLIQLSGLRLVSALTASLLLVIVSGCCSPKPAPPPLSATAEVKPTPPPEPATAPTPPPKPEPPKKPDPRQQFVAKMAAVKASVVKLRADHMHAAAYIDAMLVDDQIARRRTFASITALLKQRILLGNQILADLEQARRLYAELDRAVEDYNAELSQLALSAEADLDEATDELQTQVTKLSTTLDAGELGLFEEFGEEKVKLIVELKKQRLDSLPDTGAYFDRLEQIVRTGLVSDKVQLINFQYVARAMHMTAELQQVHVAMDDVDVANFVEDLGDTAIDAGNMVVVMNHMFAAALNSTAPQRLPPPPVTGKTVTITPDRGLGGTYYTGEQITFTIAATWDCDFILLHTDSQGNTQQLCPNNFYRNENHLRANVPLLIPGATLPYEFEASEPIGVDTVTLICMDTYEYNPSLDRLKVEPQSWRPKDGKSPYLRTRGIEVKPRNVSHGLAYDQGHFVPGAPGNAVKVDTFIKVKRKRRT